MYHFLFITIVGLTTIKCVCFFFSEENLPQCKLVTNKIYILHIRKWKVYGENITQNNFKLAQHNYLICLKKMFYDHTNNCVLMLIPPIFYYILTLMFSNALLRYSIHIPSARRIANFMRYVRVVIFYFSQILNFCNISLNTWIHLLITLQLLTFYEISEW